MDAPVDYFGSWKLRFKGLSEDTRKVPRPPGGYNIPFPWETIMAKRFKDLTEREILALAIQLEEEDSRVYGDFAEGLRETYPATAKAFDEMQAEESRHRQMLIEMHRQRFGEHIPLIRRQDVKGFLDRRPTWLVRPLGIS